MDDTAKKHAMRRILISERPLGGWGFEWLIAGAAWQARELGKTLTGHALGFIIRLDAGFPEGQLVTLRTEVF